MRCRWTLREGLVVTGLRDIPGGAPWGVYLVNFVFFIGIAHAGIAVAAAIRLLKLHDYIPIGRMAELLTVFGLMMAGLSIVFDLGRPDRVFNLIRYYPERLGSSPLIWDVTAVITYLVVSVTYLYLELREDIAKLAEKRWTRFYWLLLPGYEPGERARIDSIIWIGGDCCCGSHLPALIQLAGGDQADRVSGPGKDPVLVFVVIPVFSAGGVFDGKIRWPARRTRRFALHHPGTIGVAVCRPDCGTPGQRADLDSVLHGLSQSFRFS